MDTTRTYAMPSTLMHIHTIDRHAVRATVWAVNEEKMGAGGCPYSRKHNRESL